VCPPPETHQQSDAPRHLDPGLSPRHLEIVVDACLYDQLKEQALQHGCSIAEITQVLLTRACLEPGTEARSDR